VERALVALIHSFVHAGCCSCVVSYSHTLVLSRSFSSFLSFLRLFVWFGVLFANTNTNTKHANQGLVVLALLFNSRAQEESSN